MGTLPTPAQINAHLDEYVIGQEDAKKVLSVAVYNHYKRILFNSSGGGGIELQKSNVMMLGPTGSGKTLLASTLAKMLGVPFLSTDATGFLSGEPPESILVKLVQAAGGNIKNAERGIIYIDEIDKLAQKNSGQKGERVQQTLLKIIEGSTITLGNTQMNTGNILFIVGGAFVGLEVLVHTRIGGTQISLLDISKLLRETTPSDLKQFGLIPEFVGRLPIIVVLSALTKEALVEAMTKPKNALTKQYKQMFALDGIDLEFSQESIERIAERAIALNTGARGLRTILEQSIRDIMFKAPGEKDLKKITVTANVIDGSGEAAMQYNYAIPQPELQELQPKPSKARGAI